MTWPKSWTEMELYHWLALAGGVLAVLALVLALAMRNRAAVRVPASVAAALAGFAAGVGAARVALGRPRAAVGRQPEAWAGAAVWVLPNPSGLNAHYQLADLGRLFAELA